MSNDNNKNSKQDERLSAVETDIKWIKSEITTLKNNDLVHISKRLERIEDKLNARPTWLHAAIITGLVSVIVALIAYIL